MLEKGGAWDKFNRFTQKWEKRAIIGGAAVWAITGAPLAVWFTVEATKWFVIDWGSEKGINKLAEKVGLRKKEGGVSHFQLNHGLPSKMDTLEAYPDNIIAFPSSQNNHESIPSTTYNPREFRVLAA